MIDYKSISSAVSKYAPLLSDVISEINPVAGVIVMAIAKIFNVTPEELPNSIDKDPNADVKLRQIEIEHQDILLKNQNEDRANAREREEKIVQLTGKRDGILDWIAILVVIGFFVLCILSYFVSISDDHVLSMLIGQISSGFMLCLSYYFGSSNK